MESFLHSTVLVALIAAFLALTIRAATTIPPQEELQNEWEKNISKDFSDHEDGNITQRFRADEPEQEFLCDSTSSIIYPERAMTKESQWLLIVNNNSEIRQGIRVEVCKQEGTPCRMMDCLPNNFKSVCRQVYVYRKLLAMTPNGTIVKENFKMPSACKCAIQRL